MQITVEERRQRATELNEVLNEMTRRLKLWTTILTDSELFDAYVLWRREQIKTKNR